MTVLLVNGLSAGAGECTSVRCNFHCTYPEMGSIPCCQWPASFGLHETAKCYGGHENEKEVS